MGPHLAVVGTPHLGGHLVHGQVEGAHLVDGRGLGPDHRPLGVRRELDAYGPVCLARVALVLDLYLYPHDPVVVLLQPSELVGDMVSEAIRQLTVPSGDHHVHGNLLMCGIRVTCSRPPPSRVGTGVAAWWSPSGRPGLRPHTRLLRRSQLVCHYWPSPAAPRVGRGSRGRTYD